MSEFILTKSQLHPTPSHCSAAITPLNAAGDRHIVTFRKSSKSGMYQAKVITATKQLATTPNITSKGRLFFSQIYLKIPTIAIEV